MDTSEKNAFAAALNRLVPKKLEDVITQNCEHAALRISTEADLKRLRTCVPRERDAQDIGDWTLVTLDWHVPAKPRQLITILVGYHTEKAQGWHTSPIEKIDPGTNCIRTRSGTLYHMQGSSSREPDLLRLCAWLHQARIGVYLGAMHIFY
jgi:hypothetical protein